MHMPSACKGLLIALIKTGGGGFDAWVRSCIEVVSGLDGFRGSVLVVCMVFFHTHAHTERYRVLSRSREPVDSAVRNYDNQVT